MTTYPHTSLRRSFGIAALLLLSCGNLLSETTENLISQANELDVRLRAAEALELYQQAEKQDPKNADILVRIARQYRHLMADASSTKEKMRLGGLALDYGRRAAALAPNDSDAQLSTAISYGKMVPLQPTREQLEASRMIKAGTDKAIKLNPRNDLAWHIAGRWHRNLAEIGAVKRALAAIIYGKLPSATYEDAVNCFQKAIAINPNRLMHHIELGRTFALMGRDEEARRSIEKGLSMPDREKDDPDTKKHGREALAKLR